MRIDILTLFPNMFKGPFEESIIKRAQDRGLAKIETHQLRDWTRNKHKTVDDHPYGGGVGMVLMIEPIYNALQKLKSKIPPKARLARLASKRARGGKNQKSKVILLDAGGKKFTQHIAQNLSKSEHLILIAGHYEGVDQRIKDHLVDEVISIGDYILTGGEIPAMTLTDAIVRLIPGVLEKEEATRIESFSIPSLLEHPQYTRPEDFKGWKVPEILRSGDHKKIENWRLDEAKKLTKKYRPDLLSSNKKIKY